jgi:B12-binding domain/radical SAM domain protein
LPKADLVLLHAPSVYDFRESSIMFGPVSDMVPSTPVFEMYPIGFTTMAEYLERHGLRVRIVNLAVHMLSNPWYDVEKAIREMDPVAFGIDLHWLPHAHGAVEIAKIVKKHHPDTPVVLGGFSASYFHEELVGYPCVDYVLRGDSTEEPMLQLMLALKGRGSVDHVPNLTWRSASGSVVANDLAWVPADMDGVSLDYSYNMKAVIRDRDVMSFVPFRDWLKYPVCAALTSRGCKHNCATCGGSARAYREYFGRDRVAFRDPELVVKDVAHIQRYIPGPVFVLNDPFQAGEEYARALVEGLGRLGLRNPVAFEFFRPPSEDWWAFMEEHLPGYSAELSMESHDDDVRAAFGKRYTAAEAEESIAAAFRHGCVRFDLYFMTGLPTQSAESVLATPRYLRGLYERLGNDPRLLAFVSPMAPTLDPGSMVFDDPGRFGYVKRAHTLQEHRELMTEPSWKHILNYESDAMSREELVDCTYHAALDLNRLKGEVGVLDAAVARRTEERIGQALVAMERIDGIVAGDPSLRHARLRKLKREIDRLNESTVCEKAELNWPARVCLTMVLNVAALWLKENFRNIFGLRRPSMTPGIEQTEA